MTITVIIVIAIMHSLFYWAGYHRLHERVLRKFSSKSHNETEQLLLMAWAYADHKDKSTEWMFQYMSDFADVEYEDVIDFVYRTQEDERDKWYRENPDWLREHDMINEYLFEQLNREQ